MREAIEDVARFHAACGVPALSRPKVPSPDRARLRQALIREEVISELMWALDAGDLAGIADGIADSIYVLIGTALEYGIPLELVWNAVQASNMAKVDPATGRVRRRADGKVLKPANWRAPDITAILAAPR